MKDVFVAIGFLTVVVSIIAILLGIVQSILTHFALLKRIDAKVDVLNLRLEALKGEE